MTSEPPRAPAPPVAAVSSGVESAGRSAVAFRPARDEDVAACGALWRDATNDYTGRLNQLPIPPDLARIGRLHAHLRSTDPDRFWVAERTAPGGAPELVAFAAAIVRDSVWFLSMLFVHPAAQGRGLGRRLFDRVLRPNDEATDQAVHATATDSAQPISNALYSAEGIVPQVPLFRLVGRPDRPAALEPLPPGIEAVPFEAVAAAEEGHARLVDAVAKLDRATLGFAHPEDHRYLRKEDRRGFLYRTSDGGVVGYGYSSPVGHVGPIATQDATLVAPIAGHLLRSIEPRGASAVWVPGTAGATVASLVRAGLRIDGFPVLLCWDRPFADFGRYLPISPGLL